ncbi:MAG: hypothetical protein J6J64_01395 [Alistipes sp.]|nr:hypothetical protein [Alistipes sp.]
MRYIHTLCAVVLALALVGCSDDVINEQTAARPIVDEAPETITVGFEDEDTRIQLNEAKKTVWTKGDLVSVFYMSDANQKWRYTGETGERNAQLRRVDAGTATTTTQRVVIVYPFSENYRLNTETYNVRAMLPATQTYLKDSYGLDGNLMIFSGEYNQFSLKTINGWLKLQLTGNGNKVKSIKLRGNDYEQVAGEVYINSSEATITLAADGGASGDDSEAGGSLIFDDTIFTELTLDCGQGVELSSEVTTFYLALPPQTFKNGLTIEVEDTFGYVMTKSTDKSITIDRNTIQPMATLEFDSPKREKPYFTATWNYLEDAAIDAAKLNIKEDDSVDPMAVAYYSRRFGFALANAVVENLPADTKLADVLNMEPAKVLVNGEEVENMEVIISADGEDATVKFFGFEWDKTYDITVVYSLSNVDVNVEFGFETFDRNRKPILVDLGSYTGVYATNLVFTEKVVNTMKGYIAQTVDAYPANFAGISINDYLYDVFMYHDYTSVDTINGIEAANTKLDISYDGQYIYTTYDYRDATVSKDGVVLDNLKYSKKMTLWYGQEVEFIKQVNFIAPEVWFEHNPLYVSDSWDMYTISVQPYYYPNSAPSTAVTSFDINRLDLNVMFDLMDYNGYIVIPTGNDTTQRGIAVAENGNKYRPVFRLTGVRDPYNVETRRGILMYDNYIFNWGKDDQVNVDADLYLVNDNGTEMRIATNFDTTMEGLNDYTNFIVYGYRPISFVSSTPYTAYVANTYGVISIDLTDVFSITDVRGYELVNKGRKYGSEFLITGNGSNGYADGCYVGDVYAHYTHSAQGVVEAQDKLVPLEVDFNWVLTNSQQSLVNRGILSFNAATGIISFNNTTGSSLAQPLSIGVVMKVTSYWGTYEAYSEVTFM